MQRKIFKTGHSLAVSLSRSILKKAGLDVGNTVAVEFDEVRNAVIIRPEKKSSQLALGLSLRPKLGSKMNAK